MKPKALLSLLAVTGVFLNAEMTPAQTVLPSVRTPPADSTSGTPGSVTNHNFTVAGEIDRGRTPSDHSFQDFPILAGGTANDNQSSRSSDPNRVDNAGKMKIGTENRDNLQPDRSTVSNSVREVDLGNVSLIVSTDPTDKDDLGDIKIYTTGTLGVTNSSGISSTSFSQEKTGDISVTSDRVTLENGSIKAQSIGMIDGNIKLTALDRLLLKNLSGISLNSGNKAPTDPNNRGSQACGAIGSVTTNSSKLALPATGWVLDGAGKVTIVAMGTEIEPKQTGVVCPNMVGK
jgi:hypothetical protein